MKTNTHYCQRDEVCEEIRKSQANGTPTERLLEIARKIGEGLARRRRLQECDIEDYGTKAVLETYRTFRKLDSCQNCFSYLTSIIHSVFTHEDQQRKRKQAQHDRALDSGELERYRIESTDPEDLDE